MGAGVGLARAEPPLPVDRGEHVGPGQQLTLGDPDPVHDQALDRALHVDHLEHHAVAGDRAGVGVLAAGLGVERGLLQHDLDDVDPGSAASTSAPSTTMPRTLDSVDSSR